MTAFANHIGHIGSKFAFNDRETAVMSIATALGGTQLLLINRVRGEGVSAITADSPIIRGIGVIGTASLCLGILGLFEKVPVSRTVSSGMVGYGMSSLISIGIPIIASTVSSGSGTSPHPA